MRSFLLSTAACLLLSSLAPSSIIGQSIPGGSGTPGIIEDKAPEAHGTVVVCLALSDGLVLAADSRLTIQIPTANPNYKIGSDSSAKLFDVGKVGIATYGEAFLDGRSIGSIVADFDKERRDKDTDVDDIAKRFAAYVKPIYERNSIKSKKSPQVGFIVAGYTKQGFGEFLEIFFPDSPNAKLLTQTTHDGNQGIIWRGETDVIQRLIKGFDPSIGALPVVVSLPDEAKMQLGQQLGKIEYVIPYEYLALQDGIDLALSLVQATVDMQRFSFGTVGSLGSLPGVGGSVDVMVIDPYKLTWIKQKTLTAK